MTRLGATTLEQLLDELAAPAPGPAGASAAALAAAMAASLVEMVARGTGEWSDGARVADSAGELRRRLVQLAQDDADAVARLLELFRAPETERTDDLALGLLSASRPPLEIAVAAAEVAALARAASAEGKRVMRADASAAAQLAGAATRSAATVVETNLAAIPGDGAAAERAELSRRAGDALALAART
jgi:formiminotetrahydrofolate cyclodeaminase